MILPIVLRTIITAAETIGSLVIGFYCARAMWCAAAHSDIGAAQKLVALGAITGLTWKTAAAVSKTVLLMSWQSIGMLAAILTLRIFLKRVFSYELRRQGSASVGPTVSR